MADHPAAGTQVEDLRLLSVDVETTGLRPDQDRLLAVGLVPVDGLRIDLAGARRLVVRHDGGPGRTVVLHGLTHDVLATGAALDQVVDQVLDALRGRVLLAHHASLEEEFLSAACRTVGRAAPAWTSVDTLDLQRRLLGVPWGAEPLPGTLRLWQARQRFGLPDSAAHDALADALACAELYLAQVAELGAGRPVTWGQLRRRSRSRRMPSGLTRLLRRR
ncbi:exonuclease domain-containing protein [Nocardioides sp.]|uniref:exonuclease domain-containing protein n=1 Tax=Nocardioides sp. TaxID=35761 RepID=UPI00273459B1|nr:exonuclease domain-containing protein [Nocardioides sp.]MDP3891344.1 exonuclease domain-containing protein [Nocardioides sp.]